MAKFSVCILLLFAQISILFVMTSGKSLPSFVKPCPRTHSDVNQCLKDLVKSIKPQLIKGIPEMRIPPIDPFFIPALKMEQGTGSVNFEANFRNIRIYGASDFILNDIKFDFNGPNVTVDMVLPSIKINSDYDISGKVLVLPIKGNGKSIGNFTNISAHAVILGKYYKKNGKEHIKVLGNKIALKFGGLRINFSNLFNGNKQLSDSTNAFINENWRDIIEEINPLIEETVEQVLVGIITNILELYSIDEIFPDN